MRLRITTTIATIYILSGCASYTATINEVNEDAGPETAADASSGGASSVGGTSAASGHSNTGGTNQAVNTAGSNAGGGVLSLGGTSSITTGSSIGGNISPSGGTPGVGGTNAAGGTTNAVTSTGGTAGSSGGCASPCQNPDATHCTVSCVQGTSSASCIVKAIDADGDGYGTVACAASPGTDCDDANASVHPGATEICDGIDNNCNGLIDMHDSLPLSGSPLVQTGYTQIDLAWSPNTQGFAMVSNSNSTTAIYFGMLSPTGIVNWGTSAIVSTSYAGTSYFNPLIIWSTALGKFAFMYSAGGLGGANSAFQFLNADGTPYSSVFPVSSVNSDMGSSMAVRAAGDLLISHYNNTLSDTYISRSTGSVADLSVTLTGENSIFPRIATSGDLSAVIYQVNGTQTINWVRINASLFAGSPAQLTSGGQGPDITSVDAGYAMVWATAAGFTYQVMSNTDGSIVCGPTLVPFGNGTLNANDSVAVRTTQYGVLVLAADYDGNKIHLFRFDNNCNVIDEESVHDTASGCSMPAIAVGGGYVALAWSESEGYVRVMGERLCN